VRAMRPEDLPPIVRIDREITGRDRRDYIEAKLHEAMDDSAIRVSLTARLDGTIVGFLMARADLGDFGRSEPVAVLDTIGVDPAYGHRGVGRALVSQLFADLGALRVDRVETVVTLAEGPLLGFLHDAGLTRSRRLAFMRQI
jgi:ribosomal protein S18 acetylase RimI-like enzyme